MAIYSVSVKGVSRKGGRSATAAAAYRTASEVIDYRTGIIHDYTRRGGVDHVSTHLPVGVESMTTEDLWNRAEAAENRKNSQVARELLTALPHELDQFQRRALAEQIAAALVEHYGAAAQAAVHAPDTEGDNRNWHAHVLFTTRRMDASGQLTEKTRELDVKPRSSAEVEWIREMVEVLTNQALEQAGRPERVDRRSLADQRAAAQTDFEAALAFGPPSAAQRYQLARIAELDRLPTIHEGPRVTQIRRECEAEERAPLGNVTRLEINNEIRATNAAKAELREIEAEIIQLEAVRAQRDAAELAELVEAEQADHQSQLVSIEIEQAHAPALLANVEWHRAQIAALEGRGAGVPPPAAVRARELQEAARRAREAAERAAAEAQAWRQEHPVRAALADRAGIALGVDEAAAEAQAAAAAAAQAYSRSPLLIEARRWATDNRALRQLQERLPGVERAAGIEPQADRAARSRAALDEAARALRRAAGWIENRMSRATADEMRELSQMRREVEAARGEVERLRGQLPEPEEAERLRVAASEHLEQIDRWRPVSERPQERQEQPQERPQRGVEDAPRPPRNRGPGLG